jgi:hypothetical protein
MEPGSWKAAGKSVNVVNPELDLDFTVGRHADKYKEKVTLVVGRNTKKGRPDSLKIGFLVTFFKKKNIYK